MTSLINIGLRSEYSFKETFGKIGDLAEYANGIALGVADFDNTFSHVYLEKMAKKHGFKPLFGVRLQVVRDSGIRERGVCGPIYIFLAKNQEGVCEINRLTKLAGEKKYYKNHIAQSDLFEVSQNVFCIAESIETPERCDYIALTPSTSPLIYQAAIDYNIPVVYVNNNYYSTPEDKQVYQILAGAHKRGDDYFYNFDNRSSFQHILNEHEFFRIWKNKRAIENSRVIADACENFELKKAPMVVYDGYRNIEKWCDKGAKKLNVNLKDPIYKERYDREMKLITSKGYVDYFMIVSEMIEKAKEKMFVGPARGSSCGSLVCYLLGITTIDPIKFGLLFERFIDVNRFDLPDIDIDFPDAKREIVIKDLIKKYGENNVCSIANINKFKPKSAIADFATALRIPKFESDVIKDSIEDRSAGDVRAALSILDFFNTADIGKEFIRKYPAMKLAARVQNHASHVGKHAAGIIVCNDDVTLYGGVDAVNGSIMLDKKATEHLNLLKIDCLGLRTLTILEQCAELIGMKCSDFNNLKLTDKKTFTVFRDMRLQGIFQFEGQSMKNACKQMGIENFDDIVVMTALVRPGPLQSGGAARFISKRIGNSNVDYLIDDEAYVDATKETLGELVYQEQIMNICKNLADMDWGQVSEIRKLISKSAGEESFGEYKKAFIDGLSKKKIDVLAAETIWQNMITFGSYAMNKSHAVAYGHISYWCAYMKAHFPLEFTAANLKNAKDKSSAVKILRDAVENEGIEYLPIDADLSDIDWSVKEGRLIGGLKNIIGIADKKAREIIAMRNGDKKFTPAITKLLLHPITDFDTIYPCRDLYGDFYSNPKEVGLSDPVTYIKNVSDAVECEYIILGKVIKKELRDLNEYNEVQKRNGKILPDKNLYLRITIEDDTDQINCSINRYTFDKLNGHKWNDSIVEDKSYLLIKGVVKEGYRSLKINSIFDLTEFNKGEGDE